MVLTDIRTRAEWAFDVIRTRAPLLMPGVKVPGVQAALLAPGVEMLRFCTGVRDNRRPDPIDERTIFQIGSISKSIAAMGAVRMHHLGILDLDEPVQGRLKRWKIPGYVAQGRDLSKVTVRTLVSHTAGFNVHGYPYLPEDQPPPSAAQILAGIDGPACHLEFEFDPGTTPKYASANFQVLQMVMEDASGVPFAPWMKDNLLTPLGMHDSAYEWDDDIKARLISRHTGEGQALPRMYRGAKASSNLHTTAFDLARAAWAIVAARHGDHRYDHVIPPSLMDEMIRAQPPGLTGAMWGLGWFLDEGFRQSTFKAGGAFEGVWSWMEGFPSTGFVVVMLTNCQSGRAVTKPIMDQIRPVIAGEDVPSTSA